jgi:hypothetical protein
MNLPLPSSEYALKAVDVLPGQLIIGTREAIIHYDSHMVVVDTNNHSLAEVGQDIAACFQLSNASFELFHHRLVELTVARVGHQYLPQVQRATLPLARVIHTTAQVLFNSMPQAWSTGNFAYFFGRWYQYDLVLYRAPTTWPG